MKLKKCPIVRHKKINEDVFQLVLECPTDWLEKSGKFVDVQVIGKSLRRPISLTDWDENSITLTIKKAGEGTNLLSEMKQGELEVLLDLGNGFDLSYFKKDLLVVGGGIGCAPLIGCIKEAKKCGLDVKVIFGFRNKEQTLFKEELEELDVDYVFAYDDENENVITKMKEMKWDDLPFVTCGPLVMMKKLCEENTQSGLVSLETRMGCGFGACMGCSFKTKEGMKRICKEGPVFKKEEILWENLM